MAGASPPASEKGDSPFEYIPDDEPEMDVVEPDRQLQMNALKAEGGFKTDLGEGMPYPGLTEQEMDKLSQQNAMRTTKSGGFSTDASEGSPYPGMTAEEIEKLNAHPVSGAQSRLVEPGSMRRETRHLAPSEAPSLDPNLNPVTESPNTEEQED
jgi:hypothetical protein